MPLHTVAWRSCRRYNYRGVIVGYDSSCQQSEVWMKAMGVDSLKHGRSQPFYHVLPDVRDRPGAQVAAPAPRRTVLAAPRIPHIVLPISPHISPYLPISPHVLAAPRIPHPALRPPDDCRPRR